MRHLLGLIFVAAGLLGTASMARADVEYPYCLTAARFTLGTCYYSTLAQCQAAAAGNIGSCERNPRYVAATQIRKQR